MFAVFEGKSGDEDHCESNCECGKDGFHMAKKPRPTQLSKKAARQAHFESHNAFSALEARARGEAMHDVDEELHRELETSTWRSRTTTVWTTCWGRRRSCRSRTRLGQGTRTARISRNREASARGTGTKPCSTAA